jgi:hypothetical protein
MVSAQASLPVRSIKCDDQLLMIRKILLSTAYFPPAEYFAKIAGADEVLIEKKENYVKQSYRNRCYIISANSIQILSVPVLLGSLHKVPIADARIDYSKRWQQVHIRALKASYMSSPFGQFYLDEIETILLKNHKFLIDLNTELTLTMMKYLSIDTTVEFTSSFELPLKEGEDFRYAISPKINSEYSPSKYRGVFDHAQENQNGISIIDMVFNLGPDTARFL